MSEDAFTVFPPLVPFRFARDRAGPIARQEYIRVRTVFKEERWARY